MKAFLQRYVIKMIPFSSGDYVHIEDVKKIIERLENMNNELTIQLNECMVKNIENKEEYYD